MKNWTHQTAHFAFWKIIGDVSEEQAQIRKTGTRRKNPGSEITAQFKDNIDVKLLRQSYQSNDKVAFV